MTFYPSKIQERIAAAEHAGALSEPDAAATAGSFVCGTFVRLSLKIDAGRAEITAAKYSTNGCGYAIAACEVLAETVISRRLQDLGGVNPDDITLGLTTSLGAFPTERLHCAVLAVDALRAALAAYRTALIDEYRDDRALVCTCFGIDEDTIVNCIRDNNLSALTEVVSLCRAGSGCGSCRAVIQEILDAKY